MHRFFFDGDDAIAALVLALLGLITLVFFLLELHSKSARGDVLKVSGGLLLLFSAYSASRTLALNRLDQRTGRIIQATEQLCSEAATARSGGLWTLVELAISSKSPHEIRQRNVIDEILVTASTDTKVQIDEEEFERAREIISAGRLPPKASAPS